MKEITKGNRNINLDLLRILACVMVITIHCCGTELWNTLSCSSNSWQAMHFYDFFSRSCVPIFFMISGALFLSKKEIPIKQLYSKYILRIFLVYLIFEFLYAIDSANSLNVSKILSAMLISKQHLWYLKSTILVYMSIPILKKISEDKRVLEYSLILFFCFNILLPTLNEIGFISDSFLFQFIKSFNLSFFSYTCYFLLGYYLYQVDIAKYKNKYLLIIFILLCTVFSYFSLRYCLNMEMFLEGVKNTPFYAYFSISTFFEAICLFTIFKNLKIKCSAKLTKIIEWISSTTFGIYLIHIFVLEKFLSITNFALTTYSVVKMPLLIIIVFSISFLITSLFKIIINLYKKHLHTL
jgi:surface polysaccharide O-acyltransferase-like enzyme